MLALVVIMAILLAWALVAGRLARWSITAPLAMVVAGVALTAGSNPVFIIDLETSSFEHTVEVVLAILLFVDATETPGGIFGREPKLTARLLGVALPLTLLAALGVGFLLLPGTGFWMLAVLATVVVPTDFAPAAALIRDRRVPARLRDLLNVESGLNDGLIAPIFLFCLAAAKAHDSSHVAVTALADAIPAVLVAIAVGTVVGFVGAKLLSRSWRRHWTQPTALRLGVAALPLLTYGLAIVLHGNGFVAAFVAGAFFALATRELPEDALNLTEDVGMLLSLVVWFIFGRAINQVAGGITWRVAWYAFLVVTVMRIIPVMLSLLGTSISRRDALFLGWLGPRGLATIVFGLLAFVELTGADADLVADVMVATVVLSIVLHGLSYGPLAALYGRRQPEKPVDAAD
jgi:NhaP-type Na+/H+ or K+/H+ antiporter